MDAARAWRLATRGAFLYYLPAGYHVIGFQRDAGSGRCFYLLTDA
jgi:predicted GNAT superfamily acetyltransferase